MTTSEENLSPDVSPVESHDTDDHTLHPAPKSRCTRCLECKAALDSVGPGVQSWDAVRTLLSPAEFADFDGLASTDEEHYADTDGVLADYSFDTDIGCSFPGGHLHQNGIVAKMLCDVVLRMGLTCASKYVVNFTEVKGDLNRRRTHQGNLLRINGWAASAEKLLDGLERASKPADDVYLTMKAHLTSLFHMLKTRREDGARGTAVTFRRPQGDGGDADVPAPSIVPHLVGLAVLDGKGSAEVAALKHLLTKYRQQEREKPPLDGPSAAALAKIATSFDKRADRLIAWLRECAPFTSEANLALALAALGHENPQVRREGGDFRVSYFPTASALLSSLVQPPMRG